MTTDDKCDWCCQPAVCQAFGMTFCEDHRDDAVRHAILGIIYDNGWEPKEIHDDD